MLTEAEVTAIHSPVTLHPMLALSTGLVTQRGASSAVPIPGLRGRVEQPCVHQPSFEIRGSDFLHLAVCDCELHCPDPLSPLLHEGSNYRQKLIKESASALTWEYQKDSVR